MLRKMFLVLAISAMLTAMVVPHHTAKAAPDMQTITLNTGFDHDGVPQRAYSAIPTPDLFWSVIKDPNGATLHSAYTINKHPAWAAAQAPPNSQWISFVGDGSTGLKQGTYIYQKCFCLTKALFENKDAIAQSTLDVSVRADDAFYLGLNTIPAPGPGNNLLTYSSSGIGAFNGPPATLKLTGSDLVKWLRPGRNCLNVRVDDIGGVISGLNLVGSLTTSGIDGIAKAASPKAPAVFNNCSSCKNTRDPGAVGPVESVIRDVQRKPAN